MKIILSTMMAALALASILLPGCAGASNSSSGDGAHALSDTAVRATLGTEPLDPALAALDPQFYVVYANGMPGRTYKLGFSMGAGSPVARRVRELAARVMSGSTEIASLRTDDINTSGTSNAESGEMSGIMYGSMEWTSPGIPTPDTYVVLTLRGDSGVVIRRVELPGPGVDEAGNALHDITVIYRGVPELPEHNFSMKQGGRIAIARDGTIFMTVGDRDGNKQADYDQQLAQKLDIDVGKIIHLTAEGAPASDNPFLNRPDVRPEIWAYGIRSPEGFAVAPDGTLWETEHGPRGGDELNIKSFELAEKEAA